MCINISQRQKGSCNQPVKIGRKTGLSETPADPPFHPTWRGHLDPFSTGHF